LQNAETGHIVAAERVDGPGEASLFSLVDELTRRFRASMATLKTSSMTPILGGPVPPAPEAGLDRGITDITTTSIEAYRYYAEGLNAHERGLEAEAVPLFEKATEIDPTFAMAYAKLGIVANNLGANVKRDLCIERAVSMTSRLTPRERYYIEGFYYSLRPETISRAIEAYSQGLALHPEHQASRHNLGLLFLQLEQFPEAAAQFEELIRRGTTTPTTFENLSETRIDRGDLAGALDTAQVFVQRFPDNAAGLRNLASALAANNRFAEALSTFRKSEAINPLAFGVRVGRRNVALLQERWADAEAVTAEMMNSSMPFERFVGTVGASLSSALRGRSRDVLATLERSVGIGGVAPFNVGAQRTRVAQVLLRRGDVPAALRLLETAATETRDRDAEFETLRLLAVAQAALGRAAASTATLARLEARGTVLPGNRERRRLRWAQGQIALLRGDAAGGAAALADAAGMLPPHGPVLGPPSVHPSLLYDAGVAHLAARRDAEAARYFERLQSPFEWVYDTDAYVRSIYLLAGIRDRAGDRAAARQGYARFLEFWGEGDTEPGWIAAARAATR
jgi:tetratricopeptide (TPR) repeat protein